MVKLLLASGANINTKNTAGWSALALACAGGHPDVVGPLLQGNADTKTRTNAGDTALTLACSQGHTAIVKLLSDRGVDVNSRGLDGALHLSWLHGPAIRTS